MKITFELEPGDIDRFHEALARAERRVACAEESDIVAAARHGLETLPIASAPGYIRRRILEVERLIDMLEDEAWALPQVERAAEFLRGDQREGPRVVGVEVAPVHGSDGRPGSVQVMKQ